MKDFVYRLKICDLLFLGEILGGVFGFPMLMTSFGICGPTSTFLPAMLLMGLSSICTVANLALLIVSRREGLRNTTLRFGLACLGIPILLMTLLILRLSI
jgi:hypothetical protein